MGYVYVYDPNDEDLGTTGLVGALLATECLHEEIAEGTSAITLTHPYDPQGKWRALKRGNFVSAPCRVRTTPKIDDDGRVVTAVELWRVKATATAAQRTYYSKDKKGKKKKPIPAGTQLVVLSKGEERYEIKWKGGTWWIAHEALEFELSTTLDDGVDGIEELCPAETERPQLFMIRRVQQDTEAGTVTVYAEHISCNADDILTTCKVDQPLTAVAALKGLRAGCDYPTDVKLYTDIGDTRTSIKAEDQPLAQALLDPEAGFAARWGAQMIRDDEAMYFLRRAGRNRGVRIEHAKNLVGAVLETDDSNVVTAIKPRGSKKDGSLLYLTDDPASHDNYVISPRAGDYPTLRCAVLDAEDCAVEKNKNGVTLAIARARMREQAQARYDDDQADLPDVSLQVDFVELGATVEYARYAALEAVYLHDEVAVVDKAHGIEVMTTVRRLVWDCLNGRVREVELGNVRADANLVYSWQIPSLPGSKLQPGTVPGEAIEDGGVPPEKLDPDLQAALDKAWADIETAQQMIDHANAWLDTLDAQLEAVTIAVGDNAGAIAALQVAADAIRAAVRDAEGNIAALEITANQIATALADAEGNISTLQQTSSSMASTIADLSGSISSIQQTVGSISSTISGINNKISQFQQTLDSFGFRLYDASINQNFEVRISSANTATTYPILESGEYTGISFNNNGAQDGFVGAGVTDSGDKVFAVGGNYITDVGAGTKLRLFGSPVGPSIIIDGPANTITASRSISTSSDLRLKKEVEPLDAADLLDRLMPIRYRFKSNPKKLHFGLGYQSVKKVIQGTNYEDAALVSDAGLSGFGGICYEELIAVLIEGYHRQKARGDLFERRLVKLEGRSC